MSWLTLPDSGVRLVVKMTGERTPYYFLSFGFSSTKEVEKDTEAELFVGPYHRSLMSIWRWWPATALHVGECGSRPFYLSQG